MDDACVNELGQDICHLAKNPPRVDFSTLPRRVTQPYRDLINAQVDATVNNPLTSAARSSLNALVSKPSARVAAQRARDQDRYRQTLPRLRPSTKVLPDDVIDMARMVRASGVAYRSSYVTAQANLDTTLRQKDWVIDTDLSSREGLVMTRGGEIRVAYRGTDFKNMTDVVTDVTAILGAPDKLASQMRDSRLQIEAIRERYGRLPNELIGYSKGGHHALQMGDMFDVKSTTFNPLVGAQQLLRVSSTPHRIFRTTEDFVSSGLALGAKRNYTVQSIRPTIGYSDDPGSMHDMRNFISTDPRTTGGLEVMTNQLVRMGQRHAQMMTINALVEARERGMTFTDALLYLNKGHNAGEVLADGTLGPRVHASANFVRYWRAMGGEFTDVEAQAVARPGPPPQELSAEAQEMGLGETPSEAQVQALAQLSAQERAAYLKQSGGLLQQYTSQMEDATQPHQTVIRSYMRQAMPRSTSLATGAVGAVIAHATLQAIDPEHRLPTVAAEATEGAMAGGFGAGLATLVGASSSLGLEAVAGALAYIAAGESARAIDEALRRDGVSTQAAEGISATSAGAIGGVTASTTIAGMSILGSMAYGATFGEALGVLGGPAGVALGAAGGATVGLLIGGLGFVIASSQSHHESHDARIARQDAQQVIVDSYQQNLYERLSVLGRTPLEAEQMYEAALRTAGLDPTAVAAGGTSEEQQTIRAVEAQLGIPSPAAFQAQQLAAQYALVHRYDAGDPGVAYQQRFQDMRTRWAAYTAPLKARLAASLPEISANEASRILDMIVPANDSARFTRANAFFAIHEDPSDWTLPQLRAVISSIPLEANGSMVQALDGESLLHQILTLTPPQYLTQPASSSQPPPSVRPRQLVKNKQIIMLTQSINDRPGKTGG